MDSRRIQYQTTELSNQRLTELETNYESQLEELEALESKLNALDVESDEAFDIEAEIDMDYENAVLLRELLSQHESMAVWAAYYEADLDAGYTQKLLDEGYGCYGSVVEWAESFVNDCYDLKEPLSVYFDHEKYAFDVLQGGDMRAVDTPDGVYMFSGHV